MIYMVSRVDCVNIEPNLLHLAHQIVVKKVGLGFDSRFADSLQCFVPTARRRCDTSERPRLTDVFNPHSLTHSSHRLRRSGIVRAEAAAIRCRFTSVQFHVDPRSSWARTHRLTSHRRR
jgi:hypothetical protein